MRTGLPASVVSLLLATSSLAGEKTVYWPHQFDGEPEVTLERSAQSDNFVVFWGTLAGDDPTQAPSNIDFDPASVLAQLEAAYTTYVDEVGYLDETMGNLAQYKFIVVMNETCSDAPWNGWAFGGEYLSRIHIS